jgi:hypothetical protein
MGDGVTLLSTKPLRTAGLRARSVYGFRDITKLRVSETPPPGQHISTAGGLSLGVGQSGAVTIELTARPAAMSCSPCTRRLIR